MVKLPRNGSRIRQDDGNYRTSFKADRLYPTLKTCLNTKAKAKQIPIAKANDYNLIKEYKIILSNRVIGKNKDGSSKIGDLAVPAFAFQNKKTLVIEFNIIHDGGGSKSAKSFLGEITDLKIGFSARKYAKIILKEDITFLSHNTKDNIIIINNHQIPYESVIGNEEKVKKDNDKEVLFVMSYGINYTKEDIVCLYSKDSLYKANRVGPESLSYDLHHECVSNGSSVNKIVDEKFKRVEPSKHIRDLLLKYDNEKMFDLMGTIIMDKGEHAHLHIQYGSEMDINVFAVHQLPYVLRSKENYYEILNHFNLEGYSYEEFIERQCNPKTPIENYHPDRLVLPKSDLLAA